MLKVPLSILQAIYTTFFLCKEVEASVPNNWCGGLWPLEVTKLEVAVKMLHKQVTRVGSYETRVIPLID